MSIIIALLIFGFIIFFHELGHFLLAKKNDIKVNEFNIGMGPSILKFTRGETTYALKPLPFGGSCMMEGEDSESEDNRAFCKKPLKARFMVVFAGPLFNFILAFLLACIMVAMVGVDIPVISGVTDNSPAQEIGLKEGDTILALNNHNISFYREISVYTFFNKDKPLTVKYQRDGQVYSDILTPQYNPETGRYYLGVYSYNYRERTGFFSTIKYGFLEVKYQIYSTLRSLASLIGGRLSINDLSGPVGIVKAIGDTYEESSVDGAFYVIVNLISFTVLLSANLGVMNLIPIPALDGGRIFLYLIEAIRRKKMSEKVEGNINLVGFALLMLLMVVVLFNDIRKLFI